MPLAVDRAGGSSELGRAYPDILTCVHCGLCLQSCPTYRVLGDENDSPRGRLYLMRATVEGAASLDEAALELHLDRCLGCRACETACPAGVPYGAILERGRADLSGLHPFRRRLEALGLWVLTGRLSGALFGVLRLLRRMGLARAAGRGLPGRPGVAARLLEASRPRRPRTGPVAGADPREAAGSYALLEGCVSRGLFGHVHRATRSALGVRGWREERAPGQGCCGALHAHAGHRERARELARRNIVAFEAAPSTAIVSNAAGCGAAVEQYGEWLADEPVWADRARAVSERACDVTELLVATSPPRVTGDPSAVADEPPLRVSYDAPCHLLHGQRVELDPLAALERMPGIAVTRLDSCDTCCGGAGTYNLFQPSLSAEILGPKVREILASGCEVVATGNPGCIMQLGAGLLAAGSTIRVVHPVELLTGDIERSRRWR